VLGKPVQIAFDAGGNLLIADSTSARVRRVFASNGFIDTVAGTGNSGSSGDGGAATLANLYFVYGVAATASGDFWLSQTVNQTTSPHNRVRRVSPSGIINSVVGGGLCDNAPAINARVSPAGAEAVASGEAVADLYFADSDNNVVRYVDAATELTHIVAGNGESGYTGDGGDARAARLRAPFDVAVAVPNGLVYIADTSNNVIRMVNSNGVISTVAGNGSWGYNGEGNALQSSLATPTGIAVDRFGALYIADRANSRIRKVSGGTISTVAGSSQAGFGGDNGLATAAKLRNPWDVAVADDGTLFVSDNGNNRIRRVSPSGIITTLAGGTLGGFSGDGGLAVFAQLYQPTNLAVDGVANLYIADSQNLRIRRIDALALTIQTVAGNGQGGVAGDGGPPQQASFSEPTGVAIDPSGATMFISADNDYRVRVVYFGGIAPTPTFTPTVTWTSIPATPTRTPTVPPAATQTATSGPSMASLTGRVRYYANQQVNVPNVELDMFGPTSLTVLTNASGVFTASSVPTGNWNVAPSKNGGFGSAVSSLDAARVLQVIAGLHSFSTLQRLACDVTGDGNLSALDAVRILQFSAGVIQRMPVADICGSDWLFSPSPGAPGQSIPLSVDGGSCQQGAIFLPMSGPVTDQNFDALLLGDCTGNWSTAVGGSLRRQSGGLIVHAGYARQARGGRVRLPIYVQGTTPFQALDISVSYDATVVRFAGASPNTENDDTLVSSSSDRAGTVTVSLASAAPIDPRDGVVLMLEFSGGDADQCPAVRLNAARVDERSARVVSHDRCD
jgi:hypothetical protein